MDEQPTHNSSGLAVVAVIAVLVLSHSAPVSRAVHHQHRSHTQTVNAPARQLSGVSDIPAAYLAVYRQAAGQCPGMAWQLLAAVGKQESNHGRTSLPGMHPGEVNQAGCCAGPMQFNVTNGPPSTWDAWGRGGDPYDYRDAIPAAARKLCADGGGRPGGAAQAAALYFGGGLNDPASRAYASSVLGWAYTYGL